MRFLQLLGDEPVRGEVVAAHLVAVLQVAQEVEVVTGQRVGAPVGTVQRDRALGIGRDDREDRLLLLDEAEHRALAVLRRAGEVPGSDGRTGDLPGERVVPGERRTVLVHEHVPVERAARHLPALHAAAQVDDRGGAGHPLGQKREEAVTESDAARGAVHGAAAGGGSGRWEHDGRQHEDERESLHIASTSTGPREVPGPYGPHGPAPS